MWNSWQTKLEGAKVAFKKKFEETKDACKTGVEAAKILTSNQSFAATFTGGLITMTPIPQPHQPR